MSIGAYKATQRANGEANEITQSWNNSQICLVGSEVPRGTMTWIQLAYKGLLTWDCLFDMVLLQQFCKDTRNKTIISINGSKTSIVKILLYLFDRVHSAYLSFLFSKNRCSEAFLVSGRSE